MNTLHIDIETYSSADLAQVGVYKYAQAPDFEVMLLAYAIDDGPVRIVDFTNGERPGALFMEAYLYPHVKKCAHNANFERVCLNNFLHPPLPASQWYCTAVMAAACGYPLRLAQVCEAMGLPVDEAKDRNGRTLIRHFCIPAQGGIWPRNLPEHDPEKWEDFKNYCMQDVRAERAIYNKLKDEAAVTNDTERRLYVLDQKINDRGVLIDLPLARAAVDMNEKRVAELKGAIQELTQVNNPGSPAQLKKWLSGATQKTITTLAKTEVQNLLSSLDAGPARDLLRLYKKMAKTSVKKYEKMVDCAADHDQRARGLFQHLGAGRTGRWAGRLIQLQNLPRIYLNDINTARDIVRRGDYKQASLFYANLNNVLSQLIRTAIIAPEDRVFAVADYSAIEARVLAWLAGETWRLDVFKTHGKIYEASAAKMFGVPLESIDKDSPYRQKGKVAELALGYQGGVEALRRMGGERMGLTDVEMKNTVDQWRAANSKITGFWGDVNDWAISATARPGETFNGPQGLSFVHADSALKIKLPSGRQLYYQNARIGRGRFGGRSLVFDGQDQVIKKWTTIETYGGKLVENIVQAVARDLLADAMLRIDANHPEFEIVLHVHDEIGAECDDETLLPTLCEAMAAAPKWAAGLPLAADGYTTKYYKK